MRWSPLILSLSWYMTSMTVYVMALPFDPSLSSTTNLNRTPKRSLEPSARKAVIIIFVVGTAVIILTCLLVAFIVWRNVLSAGNRDPGPLVITFVKELHIERAVEAGHDWRLGGYQKAGALGGQEAGTILDGNQPPPSFSNNTPTLPPAIYPSSLAVSSSSQPKSTPTSKSCISPRSTSSPDGYRRSYVEEWYAPGPDPYLSITMSTRERSLVRYMPQRWSTGTFPRSQVNET